MSKEKPGASIFKNFFLSSSEGLALVNTEGKIEIVNDAFARIFKYNSDEVTGLSIEQLIPKDLRKEHHSHRTEYHQYPSKRRMGNNRDLVGLTKTGEQVPVEIALSPIKNVKGLKVAVMVTDITERKQMQMALRELNESLQSKVEERTKKLKASQHLYKLIAQNFPNGTISVFDRDLKYIFIEGQELKKLGINSEKLRGTSYLQRLPQRVKETIKEKLTQVFFNQTIRFEITQNHHIYEILAVPLNQFEEEVIDQILVVERNITAERNAQNEMEKALQREKELNELKSRFVSMASHEFRTPLTTISSSAQLISRYNDPDQQDKREKHVQRIQANVKHLTGILNDILSLSKLEEGLIQLKETEFSLKVFLEDIIEQIEIYASGKVAFDLFYNKCEDQILKSDQNILRNVLINLLSNAVKYSENGQKVWIDVNCEKDLIISIKDKGIGIPASEQGNLFDRFYRASNVTNIEGTGLGLNIVKRMVDLFGGSVNFTSKEGEGSTFTVQIPLEK